MTRGRKPDTRNRVLNYIETHHPATVMQIVRALGIDRAQLYRTLHAAYGHDFRERWQNKSPAPNLVTLMPEQIAA